MPAFLRSQALLLATAVGWVLGIVLGVGLIVAVETLGAREVQFPLVLGVAVGVSVSQFRALRPILRGRGAAWIVLSCLGLASPFVVADVAAASGRALNYHLGIFMILGGVIASVIQWSILRRVVRNASGWLVASAVGYVAAAVTVLLNDRVLPQTPGLVGVLQYLLVVLAGGVVLGALTGWAASRFTVHVAPASAPESA